MEQLLPSCCCVGGVATASVEAPAGQGFLVWEGGRGGCPERTAGQRSESLMPESTESTCCPHPAQLILPHVQVTFLHIVTSEE